MRQVADLATWICWGVFGIVWVAGALVARRRGPGIRRRESRDLASLASVAVVLICVLTPASLWRPLVVGSPWLRLPGMVLLVMATAAALWARASLGTMWSAAVVVKQDHVLHTGGPYRFTRHPIYSAILAMVAATALTQGIGRWAAIFIGVGGVVLLKLREEEQLLRDEFPDEYPRYQQRVPKLIPIPRRHRAEQA